ncbi:MAG: SURF1 family protein [Rhizobiaceae bacterium]
MKAEDEHVRRDAGSVRWTTYLVALVALCVLIGLGTWQVQRLHWKETLLADIEARRTSAPMELADVEKQFSATHDVDYQAVRLSGAYLNDKEQFFFATWKGETGFYVYTPLRLSDGRYIFVNRGFVPYDLKDPAKRPIEVTGPVTVVGLARNPLSEKPSMLVPENDLGGNIFYWKDIGGMARNAGLDGVEILPFVVDADATPNPGGLPIGGVTLIDLPNNHLQYALTWYGLAAALVAVFGVFAWRRQKGAKP